MFFSTSPYDYLTCALLWMTHFFYCKWQIFFFLWIDISMYNWLVIYATNSIVVVYRDTLPQQQLKCFSNKLKVALDGFFCNERWRGHVTPISMWMLCPYIRKWKIHQMVKSTGKSATQENFPVKLNFWKTNSFLNASPVSIANVSCLGSLDRNCLYSVSQLVAWMTLPALWWWFGHKA